MVWSDDHSGGAIPARSKRIVRLRQDNRCVCVDPGVCTGQIDAYEHCANLASIRVERSHANDPALIQGVCTPCQKAKALSEAQVTQAGRRYRKPLVKSRLS